MLNGLKSLARKEAPLSQIIHHPFFDELKEKKSIFVTPAPKRRKTTAIGNENANPKFDRASTGFSPAKPGKLV